MPMENNHGLTDEEMDRMLNGYRQQSSGRVGPCPPEDALLQYIEGTLSKEKTDALLQHLPLCNLCQDLVLSFKESASVESPNPWEHFLDEARTAGVLGPEESLPPPPSWKQLKEKLPDDIQPKPQPRWKRLWAGVLERKPFRIPAWRPVAAGLIALMLVLAFGFDWYPSELSMMAYVDVDKDPLPVDRKSVHRAIPLENSDPASYKDFYYRGRALLEASQFWILERTDRAKVAESIQYLEKAKRLAEAARDEGYVADGCFYLGKAYLKDRQLAKARQQFEAFLRFPESSVVDRARKKEAEELIRRIIKLEGVRK